MSALAKKKAKAKAREGFATIAVSKHTWHESVQLLRGMSKNWLPPQQWTQYNFDLMLKQCSNWRATGGQEIRKARAKVCPL